MSFAATAAAVVGAGVTIYSGSKQRKAAKKARERAIDPGIQPNYALDRVANTLFQNYSNYQLPGKSKLMDDLYASQATSNNSAINAATSSSDVLNLITQNQAITDASISNIGVAEASGKEQALMRYLDAVQRQGQDQIRMNDQKLGRYDAQLREAAALEGAGIQNQNQGIQDALTASAAIAGNFMPRSSVDQTTGDLIQLPSVWNQLYGKKRNNGLNILPGAEVIRKDRLGF